MMKYKLIILGLLFFPIFAVSANYTIQCNNVDEIVRGYLEELVADKWKNINDDVTCDIIVKQQDNALELTYNSSVGANILSTQNVYDDLENMVSAMISDLQQKWLEQHPIIVDEPSIQPVVKPNKTKEPIVASTPKEEVQSNSHSTPAIQTSSATVTVTKEEPQKKTGEKIKEAFITFGQAFKNFGQTFKKNNASQMSAVVVNGSPEGVVGTMKKFSDGTSGIIIYVSDDLEHGVVVSMNEYELFWESIRKRCGHDIPTLPNITNGDIAKQQQFPAGKINTSIILQSIGQYAAPAAAWCAQLGEEWYLPSAGELWYLFCIANMESDDNGPINQALKQYNGMPFSGKWYWTSTEYSAEEAYNVSKSGTVATEDKSFANMVRAFRVY